MIEIPVVGSDSAAIVDDEYSYLQAYRWRLDGDGYVMRKSAGKRIYLHHVVLPGSRYPEFVRDHINRNKLDNTSDNLRWLSLKESVQNRGVSARNSTGVRGVRMENGRFRARVQSGGAAVIHKRFDTLEQARAYLDLHRSSVLPYAANDNNRDEAAAA